MKGGRVGGREGGSNTTVDSQRTLPLSLSPSLPPCQEFYSLVDFVNPGVLGPLSSFRSHYIQPILKSRDPKASLLTKQHGQQRTHEVMAVIARFFLRRTAATVLKTLIPPKTSLVVMCRLTPAQRRLYHEVTRLAMLPGVMGNDPSVSSALGLKMIDALRKIVNHPRFFSAEVPGEGGKEGGTLSEAAIIKVLRTTKASLAAEEAALDKSRDKGGKKKMTATEKAAAVDLPSGMSGKLAVLEELLAAIYSMTPDRVVVCSSYTNTLDMLQQMCERQKWHVLRLDGSVSISHRQVS